ncbi:MULTISPECIES: MFS transporter [unclassified Pseudomonas]|uniref:MFS transporter n=1 Tax=unclassified Pseudomonas TaxID=196821 RepID=UPI0021C5B987|nr:MULTISPECIES: MFS transporter [unclassified Pseudomonas]MCU1733482.1 MFS transporter [Pseudomonas sp. 20P_3.2_Bac4]MCU1744314.1 MFS transporter [Pseudomonas sp. 20P_3.2_Bac5]
MAEITGSSASETHGTTTLGGARAWWVWCIAVAFVIYLFSVQTGYSIVNPEIQQSLTLTVTQITAIAATYTWVFAICQFFGGALLDRLGAHKVLPVSVALVTVGVFIFANASSYSMLLLSQFVMALGACTGFVGAGYIGGQWFGMAKFGLMFGLVQFCASLSSAFSVNALEYALSAMQWRALFNYIGAGGIVLTVLAFIYLRNPQPVHSEASGGAGKFVGSVVAALLDVARIPHVWVSALICSALFGSLLAAGVVWAPKLMVTLGASPATAAFSSSLLWLGLAVGCLILPAMSDKMKKRKPLIIGGTLVQLLCALALLYVPGIPVPIAMGLNFIFGVANAAHMITFSSASDVVPPQLIGTSAAFVNGLAFIAGGFMISSPGSRVVSGEASGLLPQTTALAQYAGEPILIALGIALVLSFVLRESYPKA